jgi:hypothetical protein
MWLLSTAFNRLLIGRHGSGMNRCDPLMIRHLSCRLRRMHVSQLMRDRRTILACH